MRLWLLALLLALAASALLVGSAFADASTYHSNYTKTTRACASCHRAHTAVADSLLSNQTIYGLCTSCHGTNSGLDVVDGTEWQTNSSHAKLPAAAVAGGTKGGGFVNSLMNTTMAGSGNPVLQPAALKPSSSAHVVKGMNTTYAGDTMWGSGSIIGTAFAGATATLECTSCHDPHGKSGVDASGNKIPTYRLLRSMVNTDKMPAAQTTRVNVPEDAASSHEYIVDSSVKLVADPNSTTQNPLPDILPSPLPDTYGTYYGQTYELVDPTSTTTPPATLSEVESMQALSNWCAACHTRIHASSSSASGDNIYAFRHPTNGGAVDDNYGKVVAGQPAAPSGYPGCLSCHTAHGSSADMFTISSSGSKSTIKVLKPGVAPVTTGTQPASDYLDSVLLRVDNRGVCELCHNK